MISDTKHIADSNTYLWRAKLATLDGLKTIRIHDLRHSCALLLINNGANVTSVAKYLRYTKIEEKLNTYSTKLFYWKKSPNGDALKKWKTT